MMPYLLFDLRQHERIADSCHWVLAIAKHTKATLLVAKLDRLSRKVSFIATLMEDPKLSLKVASMPSADNRLMPVGFARDRIMSVFLEQLRDIGDAAAGSEKRYVYHRRVV